MPLIDKEAEAHELFPCLTDSDYRNESPFRDRESLKMPFPVKQYLYGYFA